MNEDIKLNLYILAIAICGILIGYGISQLQEQDNELENIITAENIINECKNRYNQDYIIKNDLVIEFLDGGKDE